MTDVAVIGGGASGLAAAAAAAGCGAGTVIAERLTRVGKKILATGNSRCNLSHEGIRPSDYRGSFDTSAIIGGFDAKDYFMKLGLFCRTDDEGRIYPYSNQASGVLDALRLECARLGVTEKCGFDVRDFRETRDGYELFCDCETISARRIIIACGGYAAPSMGTDGAMLRLLRDKGIATVSPVPSLAAIKTPQAKELKGVRVKGRVTAAAGGKILGTQTGEIQFNDDAISGICVYNLARFAAVRGLVISVDLMPEFSEKQILELLLLVKKARQGTAAEDFLTGILPKRVAQTVIKRTGVIRLQDETAGLSRTQLEAVCRIIKSLDFSDCRSSSWGDSQVTAGGIRGDEITDSLRIKKYSGIYVCGEIIDADGDCGGYNLNWAWSSGRAAGVAAAESLGLSER